MTGVAWAPSGILFVGRYGGLVERFDPVDLTAPATSVSVGASNGIAVHPEGRFVASLVRLDEDGTQKISVWDGEDGAPCGVVEMHGLSPVSTIEWSADGMALHAVGQGQITVFDVQTGRVQELRANTKAPDPPVVAHATPLDSADTSRLVGHGLRAMAIHDGVGIAIWDLASGNAGPVIQRGSFHVSEGFALVASPDGNSDRLRTVAARSRSWRGRPWKAGALGRHVWPLTRKRVRAAFLGPRSGLD